MNKFIFSLLIMTFTGCFTQRQITTATPQDLNFKPSDFSIKIADVKESNQQPGNKAVYFIFEIKNLSTRDFDSRQYSNDEIYIKVDITTTDNETFSFEKNLGWYDYVIPSGTLKSYGSLSSGANLVYIGKRTYKSSTITVYRKYR